MHLLDERFGVIQNKSGETDEEFKPDWMPGDSKVKCLPRVCEGKNLCWTYDVGS